MLVITRKVGESFFIGDDIEVFLVDGGKDKARIGINAPRDVSILRKELKVTVEQNKEASYKNNSDTLRELAAYLKK